MCKWVKWVKSFMKNINKDIKELQFKKIYLLYGEEDYLIKMYRDKLMDAITGNDPMNTMKYEGDKIDIQSLIDDINTAPFFADYRLILIENTNLFKKANDDLVETIGNVPDGTVVVFVQKEVDKRGKLFKQIKANGYPCEMGYLSEGDLFNWTLKKFNSERKNVNMSHTEVLNIVDSSSVSAFCLCTRLGKSCVFSCVINSACL